MLPNPPPFVRPLRIPTHLSLQFATPPTATVATFGTWRLPFVLNRPVSPPCRLIVQIQGGRNNHGGFIGAQVENPRAPGYLSAEWAGRPLDLTPKYPGQEFVITPPPDGFPKGTRLTITLGDRTHGSPGIQVKNGYALNKFFVLFTEPPTDEINPPPWAGGRVWNEISADRIVSVCLMHILGGPPHHLRVYAPATVRPDVSFPILLRPEDRFGNLATGEIPNPITLRNAARILEAHPGNSPAAPSRLLFTTLSQPGIHRVEVHAGNDNLLAVSNPILCSADAIPTYWGMIHGHTEMSDGAGSLDQYFHQLRDGVLLDFAASSDHDHLWETSDAFWQITCEAVERWNEPRRFPVLLGYEWAKWRKNGDGDRNVYFRSGRRPLYRSDEGHYPSPPDLFSVLRRNGEKALVIPHHTAHGGNFCDWKDHDPHFERLVEIFQVRGSYECPPEEGNPLPEKQSIPPPFPKGYVRNALAAGWRVGFTAGGDDHRGDWGTETAVHEKTYKQGLLAVHAPNLTREAIFDALHARRTIATSGPRILLDWTLNGLPLGSETSLSSMPELVQQRLIRIEAHGTAPIEWIEIIRCNQPAFRKPGGQQLDLSFKWVDKAPLANCWLPPTPQCPHPFAFYYVRLLQTDGEMAWASPVWIDP